MKKTKPDDVLEDLYLQVARIRHFEAALHELWTAGLIPGEMHLGTGEEGVVAGVVANLVDGDAMALDHRSTPPLVARGVDLKAMVLEMLGSEKGLCAGMGGHMHLFSREHLAASSGIVGSSVPMGSGFALAAQQLSPGKVAVAFLGEGAMNQGMVLEGLNLAVTWKLPLVIVCKDNGWSITTRTRGVTGGGLVQRARAFGMRAVQVDGFRVDRVCKAAGAAVRSARAGRGPTFIHARCMHIHGHFIGDPVLRIYGDPIGELKPIAWPLVRAISCRPGAGMPHRVGSLTGIGATLAGLGYRTYVSRRDPYKIAGRLIDASAQAALDAEARDEVRGAVEAAISEAGVKNIA
jgi:pyruvate dehydrogenase E1 component alpha subunit